MCNIKYKMYSFIFIYICNTYFVQQNKYYPSNAVLFTILKRISKLLFYKICVTLNLKCIYSIHSYLYIYVCNYADNLAWSKRPSYLLKSGLPEPAIFDMSGFASGSELISAPASAPSFTSTSTLKHVILTGT